MNFMTTQSGVYSSYNEDYKTIMKIIEDYSEDSYNIVQEERILK